MSQKITRLQRALIVNWKLTLVTANRTLSEQRIGAKFSDLPADVPALLRQDTMPKRFLSPIRAIKERLADAVSRATVSTELGQMTSPDAVRNMHAEFEGFKAELAEAKRELIDQFDEAATKREVEIQQKLSGHPLEEQILDAVRKHRPSKANLNKDVDLSWSFYHVESPSGYSPEIDEALSAPLRKVEKSIFGKLVTEVVDEFAVMHEKFASGAVGAEKVNQRSVHAAMDLAAKFERLKSFDPRCERLTDLFSAAFAVLPKAGPLEGEDRQSFITLLEAASDREAVLKALVDGVPLMQVKLARKDAKTLYGANASQQAPRPIQPTPSPVSTIQPKPAPAAKPTSVGWAPPSYG